MTLRSVILVTGATGNQGSAVTKSLLQQGTFMVRALVRNKTSEKATALESLGAELVEGDYEDVLSLTKALQGVYGVFSMQDFAHGVDTEVRQGTTIADLAKKADVKHFIYSSVGSANRQTGIPHFESKHSIEEHIRTIDLPYTILRPVYFMYNLKGMRDRIDQGFLSMPLRPQTTLQQLSEQDYGNIVAKVFSDKDRFLSHAIDIASVDISMTRLAECFSHAVNKPVVYEQISFDSFRQQAGDETARMFTWFDTVGYAANVKELEKLFFPLSSVDAYLRQHWDHN
jgi:uncharacterized protein YbjT (DUF2867 family)